MFKPRERFFVGLVVFLISVCFSLTNAGNIYADDYPENSLDNTGYQEIDLPEPGIPGYADLSHSQAADLWGGKEIEAELVPMGGNYLYADPDGTVRDLGHLDPPNNLEDQIAIEANPDLFRMGIIKDGKYQMTPPDASPFEYEEDFIYGTIRGEKDPLDSIQNEDAVDLSGKRDAILDSIKDK